MQDEIKILSEIEAIRQNPGMYIGSLCDRGAHHLLSELLHNSLDEVSMGFCDKIEVTIQDNHTCTIKDNGRGVPTEMHSQEKIPSCEVALTRLHAGSKFEKAKDRFTAGLHGVGLSCVNALSERLDIQIARNGRLHTQSYARGVAETPLKVIGPTDSNGTTIQFKPDKSIFKSFTGFSGDQCRDFLEDLAFLHPGLEISYKDLRSGLNEAFRSSDSGLKGLLEKCIRNKRVLLPQPVAFHFASDGLRYEALLTWTSESSSTIKSFVNGIPTEHGGTHVNALFSGVLHGLRTNLPVEMEEIQDGLCAVISCQSSHPTFDGQTKSRFTSTENAADIERAVVKKMVGFLSENPKAANVIYDRLKETRNARLAAKRIAERIYFQNIRQGIDEAIYKEQFGARSRNWHDSAVWITDQQLLQSHAEMFKLSKDAIALDVCCGSGVVGASFRGKVKKVVGLDLTPEMVRLAGQRLDEVVQGNVYNIPFADQTFDLVCTREVLHLLPFPERPVSEIFRVLKPGGQFIVGQILPFSEADAVWMYRVFKKKQPLIHNMFQEEDFRKLLLGAGFVDLEMQELNVWESIDVWIDSYETTPVHRFEIRELFRQAPREAKAVHPFEISSSGEIRDLWRWCVFSVRKPK